MIAAAALLVALPLGYLAFRAAFRGILYPAPSARAAAPEDATELSLTATDGAAVRAWRFDPERTSGGAPTRWVVVFHGNGETIASHVETARTFAERGVGALLVEYRGYGGVPGSPSEEGLYADAEAAIAALGAAPRDVVLLGYSLGSGVAIELARRGRGGALVVLAPYTSIVDVARGVAPGLPRWLVPDRFESLDKAPAVRVPALVIHGTDDRVVPYAMGERLAAALPQGRLLTVPGGSHVDLLSRDDVVREVVAFVGASPSAE